MNTFKLGEHTIHHNSDYSGDAIVTNNGGPEITIPCATLIAFGAEAIKSGVKTEPSYVCCYCRLPFFGQRRYEVPPDYPQNPAHAGLPLCDVCGGPHGPTLEQICDMLDAEAAVSTASPTPAKPKHVCGLCHKEVSKVFRTLAGLVCAPCMIAPSPRAPGCPTR